VLQLIFAVIVAANAADPKPHVNAIIDFGDMCRHLRIVDLATCSIADEKVAEKSSVCLSAGNRAITRRTSGQKPMSSIRSASSRISVSTFERSSEPRSM
jgi:hypothetical protein